MVLRAVGRQAGGGEHVGVVVDAMAADQVGHAVVLAVVQVVVDQGIGEAALGGHPL